MKKHFKLLVFISALFIVFLTYRIFQYKTTEINYIALGDSVAEGMGPYGAVGYGYPDYISDYLKSKERLNFYTKGFSKSGYTVADVKRDIENNKTITVNKQKVNIKEALRESDLVTISIGANDFIRGLSLDNFTTKLEDIKATKKEIDEIGLDVKELIELIKDYAKGEIILIGYYNPLPRIEYYKDEIDELVKYSNHIYEEICDDLDITYVDVFDEFERNKDYLPNSLDIHPSIKGYEAIANKIIKEL